MNSPARKRSITDKIKHRTPEIVGIATMAAGAFAFYHLYKQITTPVTVAQAFAAHAGDASVELITGDEQAFVVLSKLAADTLQANGEILIGDPTVPSRYLLTHVNY